MRMRMAIGVVAMAVAAPVWAWAQEADASEEERPAAEIHFEPDAYEAFRQWVASLPARGTEGESLSQDRVHSVLPAFRHPEERAGSLVVPVPEGEVEGGADNLYPRTPIAAELLEAFNGWQARRFAEDLLPRLIPELREAEQRLEEAGTDYSAYCEDAFGELGAGFYEDQLGELETRLFDRQVAVAGLEARLEALERRVSEARDEAMALLWRPRREQIEERLERLEEERERVEQSIEAGALPITANERREIEREIAELQRALELEAQAVRESPPLAAASELIVETEADLAEQHAQMDALERRLVDIRERLTTRRELERSADELHARVARLRATIHALQHGHWRGRVGAKTGRPGSYDMAVPFEPPELIEMR